MEGQIFKLNRSLLLFVLMVLNNGYVSVSSFIASCFFTFTELKLSEGCAKFH